MARARSPPPQRVVVGQHEGQIDVPLSEGLAQPVNPPAIVAVSEHVFIWQPPYPNPTANPNHNLKPSP